MSTPASDDEKEEMLGEGCGVLSNSRKLDLILLFLGQRQTQLSNQP